MTTQEQQQAIDRQRAADRQRRKPITRGIEVLHDTERKLSSVVLSSADVQDDAKAEVVEALRQLIKDLED